MEKRNVYFRVLLERYKHIKSRDEFMKYLYESMEFSDSSSTVTIRQMGMNNQDRNIALLRLPIEWIPTAGFYALLNRMMCALAFADRFGFTPVADKWIHSSYQEEMNINGTDHVFEYYFEPLSDISLKEAKKSYNVMIPSNLNMDMVLKQYHVVEWYRPSEGFIGKMGELYRKYICLNNETKIKIENDISKILQCGNVLGVHIRGTDFKLNHNLHPAALKVEDYEEYIEEAVSKYGFEKIFLATDDIDIRKKFYKKYGDRVRSYENVFRTEGNVSVAYSIGSRKNHKYLLGYEVIRDVYTLAACNGFIAGNSQVSVGVRINKAAKGENFIFQKIIDKGINYNSNDWKLENIGKRGRNARKK